MLLLPKHLPFFASPRLSTSLLYLSVPSHLRFRPLSCSTSSSASGDSDTTTTSPTSASPDTFCVETYLVETCRLYTDTACRAAEHLSELKSPSNPDAVLAFLRDHLGMSPDFAAAVIAVDPKILTASVRETLAPRAAELRDLGFSNFHVGVFLYRAGPASRAPDLISRLRYLLPFYYGRVHKLILAVETSRAILTAPFQEVLNRNIEFLQQECGLNEFDIAWLSVSFGAKLLTATPAEVDDAVERAEALGVHRGSRAFTDGLITSYCCKPEKVQRRMEFFRELGWSEEQIASAVSRLPTVLMRSEEKLRQSFEFLTNEAELDVDNIASFPAMLKYNLEFRLVPRLYVHKLLKSKRLLEKQWDFRKVSALPEGEFVLKFVRPFNLKLPHLADTYAAMRRGIKR